MTVRRITIALAMLVPTLFVAPAQAAKQGGPIRLADACYASGVPSGTISATLSFGNRGDLRRVEVAGCSGMWSSIQFTPTTYPSAYGRIHLAPGKSINWDRKALSAHNIPTTNYDPQHGWGADLGNSDPSEPSCIRAHPSIWVVWPDDSVTPYPTCP